MSLGASATPHRILLLRHGQSTWNEQGRWQGLADPPLTELGQQQCRDSIAFLKAFDFDRVFASDLIRAARTAELIARSLALEVQPEPRWRERDAGDFTGLTNDEIHQRFPEVAALHALGKSSVPPNANNEGFDTRAIESLLDVAKTQNSRPILIVTHAGFIRVVERSLATSASPKLPNLSGRWIEASSGELRLGEIFLTGVSTPSQSEDSDRV